MRRLTGDRGLTLIEVAVAILILAIGTLAALRSLDISTTTAGGAEARVLAQIAVRNRAEELRLFGPNASLPDTVTIAGRSLTVDQDSAPTAGGLVRVTLVARAEGSAGAQLVIFVPPGAPG